jgi:hypothetical protein
LSAIYPYLPERMLDMLVQNNVDEGLVAVDDGHMTLTDAGREIAQRAKAAFDAVPKAMWEGQDLDVAEQASAAAVAHGRKLPVVFEPSAFAVQAPIVDSASQAGRLFRGINALRYWRADAHRAAWTAAGLNVQEAHALNRLWDMHRDVERVGQGEERPGRTGVAGLTEKGLAANDAITDVGIKAREAIEADTDARTEPVYAPLDEAARLAFLDGLRQLPVN